MCSGLKTGVNFNTINAIVFDVFMLNFRSRSRNMFVSLADQWTYSDCWTKQSILMPCLDASSPFFLISFQSIKVFRNGQNLSILLLKYFLPKPYGLLISTKYGLILLLSYGTPTRKIFLGYYASILHCKMYVSLRIAQE